MNVLADRHHAGLYRSLQLLGDRLGWNLYTPVGMDWWDAGVPASRGRFIGTALMQDGGLVFHVWEAAA